MNELNEKPEEEKEDDNLHPLFRDILRPVRDPAWFAVRPSNSQMEYFKRGGR